MKIKIPLENLFVEDPGGFHSAIANDLRRRVLCFLMQTKYHQGKLLPKFDNIKLDFNSKVSVTLTSSGGIPINDPRTVKCVECGEKAYAREDKQLVTCSCECYEVFYIRKINKEKERNAKRRAVRKGKKK